MTRHCGKERKGLSTRAFPKLNAVRVLVQAVRPTAIFYLRGCWCCRQWQEWEIHNNGVVEANVKNEKGVQIVLQVHARQAKLVHHSFSKALDGILCNNESLYTKDTHPQHPVPPYNELRGINVRAERI